MQSCAVIILIQFCLFLASFLLSTFIFSTSFSFPFILFLPFSNLPYYMRAPHLGWFFFSSSTLWYCVPLWRAGLICTNTDIFGMYSRVWYMPNANIRNVPKEYHPIYSASIFYCHVVVLFTLAKNNTIETAYQPTSTIQIFC